MSGDINCKTWRKILQDNCDELVNFLDVDVMLESLLSKEILVNGQIEEIKKKQTATEKGRTFFDMLIRIDSGKYIRFLKILKVTRPDIANKLAEDLGVTEHLNKDDEVSSSTEQKNSIPRTNMTLPGPQRRSLSDIGPDVPTTTTDALPCSEQFSIESYEEDTDGDVHIPETVINRQERSGSFLQTSHTGVTLDSVYLLVQKLRNDQKNMDKRCMEEFNKLHQANDESSKNQEKMYATVIELKNKCTKLETDMTQLQSQVAKVIEDIDSLKAEFCSSVTALLSNGLSLLIGDQLIKDICISKLHQTRVICTPGAKVSDFLTELTNFKSEYVRLILCIGTNNCADSNFNIKEIIEVFMQIIKLAKAKVALSMLICVSSIPPRRDQFQQNVEAINVELSSVANEHSLTFINNDLNFKDMKKEAIECYFEADGVHLTPNGTNKLAQNMKLTLDAKVTDGNFFESNNDTSFWFW